MNPMTLDVTKKLAGAAHADAEPNAKQAKRRYATGLRTQYNHREEGPPEMRDAQLFLLKSGRPVRQVVGLLVAAQHAEIEGKSEREVIELYHATIAEEKAAEAQDTILDLDRSTCWLDKALATERDMAAEARKAACERWFAVNRTDPAKVRAR